MGESVRKMKKYVYVLMFLVGIPFGVFIANQLTTTTAQNKGVYYCSETHTIPMSYLQGVINSRIQDAKDYGYKIVLLGFDPKTNEPIMLVTFIRDSPCAEFQGTDYSLIEKNGR